MITLPPFKAFLASNIPSVYDNTLSYYDELTKLIAYLEQQVVPAVNETAGQVDGIKNGLEDLKSYVDHYFDNLDVQEEINNKLDAMAAGGQLAGIIAQFLEVAPVFAYDTVAAMSSADNLAAGCIARTLGYTTAGDGKGAFYKIETLAAQVIDNNIYIAVGATLVAHKAMEYGYADPTNPIYYGADPTGTVDSASAINACIVANLGGAIKFTGGKYIVNSPILTPYRTSETVNIDFGGATLYTEAALDYVLGIGYYHIDYDHMPNGNDYTDKSCYGVFENFVIDAINATVGVMTNQNYWYPRLYNFSIFNTLIGIQLGQNRDLRWSSDAAIDNGYIQCKSYANRNTRGIVIYGYDNKITNCRIYNAFIGIEDKKGGNYFINNHIYIYGNANDRETPEYANLYPDTIAFYANGANNDYFESVYFDSYNTAFKHTGSNFIGSFYQCFYGTNTEGFDGNCLDFSEGTIANLSVRDCTFSCERPSENGKNYGLKLSTSQAFDVLSRGLILENNTCYWLPADPLTIDTSKNGFQTYRGSYTFSNDNYYVLGLIPVSEYNGYVINLINTSSPAKSLMRVWIGANYSIELNNIGTAGSDYSVGAKIVEIRGIKMLEISYKPVVSSSATIGICLQKDSSSNAIGIMPPEEQNIVTIDPSAHTTTPTAHTEYQY